MPFAEGSFVGRAEELSALRREVGLDGPASPGGRVVLSGDAGIGKSRLVRTLALEASDQGWLVVTVHCIGQGGSALPYLPFVELVGLVDTVDHDTLVRVREGHPGLAQLAASHGPASDSDSPSVGALPALVAQAVDALLNALGAIRPTLLVVEDVHWADHSSRDLLTLLLTRGFATEVSLLVTYRSDDVHRRHPLHDTLAVWARLAQVQHVELAPLADEHVSALVADIGGPTLDAATTAEIVRRAEGNAFFAEELAVAALGGSPGGSLGRVLHARIERLAEATQRLVRAVAVGSSSVPHELLALVVGFDESALEAAVADAVEHHVLLPRWPPAYAFRHALLGEAIVDGLLPGERLRWHRRYAAVLSARPDLAPVSELARHAASSGDLDTAVTASRAAAEAALAVGGPYDALDHLERVLDWLADDDPARDEVTLRASDAAMAAGDPLRSVGLLRDRLDNPGTRQAPGPRAQLLATYASRSRTLDLPVDATALLDEAERIVSDEDGPRRLTVLVARLQHLVDQREWQQASELADRAAALAQGLDHREALTEIRVVMTKVIEAMDDLDAAERHMSAILAGSRPEDPVTLRLLHQLASFSHRRGDLVGSLARFDEGVRVAKATRREWAPWGLECRLTGGLVAYELGDWADAAERLDVRGAAVAQPGRALFDAARLTVSAGRGEPVDPAAIHALRQWWAVDGLSTVFTATAGIDLLGDAGDVVGALGLATEAMHTLDQAWGTYHASVRLAALAAGQAAAAARRADPRVRRQLLADVDALVRRAERVVERGPGHARGRRPSAAPMPPPGLGGSVKGAVPLDTLTATGRETWAWALRLEAELLRLRWLAGTADPPTAAAMVAAWTASVAAFRDYGHVFETARSTARLAEAQHAAGDIAASRATAAAADEVASRLGARPLRAELARWLGTRPSDTGAGLTARELEVLALLERGLSNGQIGKHLYITTKTVSVHVSNLLAKLGASSRTEAAAVARDRGLIG